MTTLDVCDICKRECTDTQVYNNVEYGNFCAGRLILRGATGVTLDEDGVRVYKDTGSITLEHLCMKCATSLGFIIDKMREDAE